MTKKTEKEKVLKEFTVKVIITLEGEMKVDGFNTTEAMSEARLMLPLREDSIRWVDGGALPQFIIQKIEEK